ncbi:MAG: single-stranded DNA-binding protein [Cyclobacteriaceae bacterium]|nr:single-stranded DNA-binding protein [Cyclobacteriaceae bacterium]
MAGVNKVILIGNLGSDPEVRHLSSGSVVANFNIATSESYTNKNGEKVSQTEWHRIELWDGLAKVAEQYLKKGQMVYVEGKLKTENWQDSDGNNRTTTRVRGLSMTMLGGKGSNESSGGEYENNMPESKPQQNASQPKSDTLPQTQDEEDDLPF